MLFPGFFLWEFFIKAWHYSHFVVVLVGYICVFRKLLPGNTEGGELRGYYLHLYIDFCNILNYVGIFSIAICA